MKIVDFNIPAILLIVGGGLVGGVLLISFAFTEPEQEKPIIPYIIIESGKDHRKEIAILKPNGTLFIYDLTKCIETPVCLNGLNNSSYNIVIQDESVVP